MKYFILSLFIILFFSLYPALSQKNVSATIIDTTLSGISDSFLEYTPSISNDTTIIKSNNIENSLAYKPSAGSGFKTNSFLLKKNSPDDYMPGVNLQNKSFLNKLGRAISYTIGYDVIVTGWILIIPQSISKWDVPAKFNIPAMKKQYHRSYTEPPVIDDDMFVVNYIGHPYQGGFYYNTMRSQGASVLQSSLFCIGQSLVWEYVYEAGMEQPSIQDMITTPFIGIIVGELCHVATLKMSKNGFKWYEIPLVCILNPSYAINNKFRFNKNPRQIKPAY